MQPSLICCCLFILLSYIMKHISWSRLVFCFVDDMFTRALFIPLRPFFFGATNAHQDAQIVARRCWHEICFMHLWMWRILYIGQDQVRNVFTRDFNSRLYSAESLPHSLLDEDTWSISLQVCICVSLCFLLD